MKKHLPFVVRIIVAIILVQTLRFKFTGHPDSVYIFTKVRMEPYGRILIGVVELIAAIFLLIPKLVWVGALLTLGVIGGAITMHLTNLGIEINNDNGILFITALATILLSVLILYWYKKDIPYLGKILSF